MFKQIVNPVNNKLVNVKSKEGLEILNNYINKLGGAEQSTGQSTSERELVDEQCMCIGCRQERERDAYGLIVHHKINISLYSIISN